MCWIKNSYLVTVPGHEPGGHEPPIDPRARTSGYERPRFASVRIPLWFLWFLWPGEACGTASRTCSVASSAMTSKPAAAKTASWISRSAAHPRADGIASFDQHCSPHITKGLISRPQQGLLRSQGEQLGVVLGSLGRGMQADGVWAHLPATTGPTAAVPARGCPDRVATRPGAQSARVCQGYP
jgi:hypothetical protein